MAWDRVTLTTIASCFGKCGFFRIPEEVPQALSESEEPIEGWECLDAGCSADDFCTADHNLATCGARTVEDIVNEATCEVADSSDDDEEMDECDGEGLPPAAETARSTSSGVLWLLKESVMTRARVFTDFRKVC
ncbi:hypothetical protein MRX96_056659 [Rhipicephalus microplus]